MAANVEVTSEPTFMIPNAAAVPINDDGEFDTSSPSTQLSSKDDLTYASARVIDVDASPNTVLLANNAAAATFPITAIALDPWSKEPTAASTMADTVDPTTEDQQLQSLNVVVTVPSDSNEIFSQERRLRRRKRRRGRMIIAGATGFVVGAMVLGPIGAYAGAIGGAAVAHGASKAGERRKDRRVARRRQQQENQAGATHIRNARASR